METNTPKEDETRNIIICEWIQKETEIPSYLVEILSKSDSTVLIKAKDKLKSVLEGSVISEFFKQDEVIFDGSQQHLMNVDSVQQPVSSLSLTQKISGEIFVLNLLVSQFRDLNLSEINKEIKLISQALSGTFKRTTILKEMGEITSEKQEHELEQNLQRLGNFYQWKISEEYSLRGGRESATIAPMITSAVLLKANILQDFQECIGECGRVYSLDSEETHIKCECGGDIILSPPKIIFENVAFIYPNELNEIISREEEISPENIYNLVQKAFIPRRLFLKLNQVEYLKFNNKVVIPSEVDFRIKDITDTMKIIFEHEIASDGEVKIFACITDTRYNDSRLQSSISLPIILRDIKNGLQNNLNLEEIIQKTELREWNVTPFIKIKELTKISNFKQIDTLFQRSDNIE